VRPGGGIMTTRGQDGHARVLQVLALRLPDAQNRLMCALATHLPAESRTAVVAFGDLVAEAGQARGTVRAARQALEKSGMLASRRTGDGRGSVTEWTVLCLPEKGVSVSDPFSSAQGKGVSVSDPFPGKPPAPVGNRPVQRARIVAKAADRPPGTGRLASWSAVTLTQVIRRLKRDGPYTQAAANQGEHHDRIELYGRMFSEGKWTADQRRQAVNEENKLWRKSRG
jgi:hypothetical protein